jgi:hypothetical protein
MRVYRAYDNMLRVRIGQENLGSESLGPWYGGTGAIRLRQVLDTWFWAYGLDDNGYRGTARLPESEFQRIQEHIPSAHIVAPIAGDRVRNRDVSISDADLAMLEERVVPLRTRVAPLGDGVAATFGDWQIEVIAQVRLGLFHLGGRRFNGFRIGFRYTTLSKGDLPKIIAQLPSARIVRDRPRTIVEASDTDLARLSATAKEA